MPELVQAGKVGQTSLEGKSAAREIDLRAEDLDRLAEALPVDTVTGDRYPDMRTVER